MTISRIRTLSSRIKDNKKDCATKKLESPFSLPAFLQLRPFSFMQKYQNFTSAVKTSLCCGLSPSSVTEPAALWSHPPVCNPVAALDDLGPGTATHYLFFHWGGIVFSPVSLLWQTEVALTLEVQSPSVAQLNKAVQRCVQRFCYQLQQSGTACGQKLYQSLFHWDELVIHAALSDCIQHGGCFSHSDHLYLVSIQCSA